MDHKKNTLIDKLNDSMLKGLSTEEMDTRLSKIRNDLGIYEQMAKLPGNPKLHQTMALRSIGRSLYGYEGEVI